MIKIRVLVTGDKGYIGSLLVPHLIKLGYQVTGLDTGYFTDCLLYPDISPKYDRINKDIRNISQDDLQNIDCIFHLAALSNDPLCNLSPDLTNNINFKATLRLANIAKKIGVKRFFFSSSCSIYGNTNGDIADENFTVNPLTTYSKYKFQIEQELQKIADDSFKPVFLRNATVYGLSPFMRFDLVINNLVANGFCSKKIELFSDGDAWRPFIHIRDLIEIFGKLLEIDIDKMQNQSINIGCNDSNYQIMDVANQINRMINGSELIFRKKGKDIRSYIVNFNKMNKILSSYKCQWNISKGVIEILEKLKQIDFDCEEFNSSKFSRVNRIMEMLKQKKIDEKLFWID